MSSTSPAGPGESDSGRAWALAWLLPAAAALFLSGLGDYALWDPEEGRHAEIARRLGDGGRWLVPQLYGTPYYDKPTGFYWLLRATFATLGTTELAARLPSALATLGTLVLLHRFARRHFGGRTAITGAVIYATMPLVVMLGRYCNLDAVLAFFVTWATLRFLDWIPGPRTRAPWSAYLAMALGTLVKGPVALLLPCSTALLVALRRGGAWRALRAAAPIGGLLLVGLLVGPWLAGTAVDEPPYLQTFFLEHNLQRFLSSEFEHVRDPTYFVRILPVLLLPWSLLLPAALGPGREHAGAKMRGDLLIWAAVVIGFFSIGRAKLASYVLPAMPPLALWLGARLTEPAPEREARIRGALRLWAYALLAVPPGLYGWARFDHPELVPASAWSLVVIPIAGAALYAARTAPERLAVPVLALGNALLFGVFYNAAAPAVSSVASDRALARAAAARPDLAAAGFRIQPASFSFYSEKEVPRIDAVRELRARLRHGPLFIVTRRRHEPSLTEAGIPLHEWLDNGRHVLYATVPRSDSPARSAASLPMREKTAS